MPVNVTTQLDEARLEARVDDMRPDRRRQRAQMFTAEVLRVVGRYVCDHGEENHDNMKRLHRDLFALFYDQGFDAVTDLDRANVGLPLRDDKGWTEHELRVLEEVRLEMMRRPMIVEARPGVLGDPLHGAHLGMREQKTKQD